MHEVSWAAPASISWTTQISFITNGLSALLATLSLQTSFVGKASFSFHPPVSKETLVDKEPPELSWFSFSLCWFFLYFIFSLCFENKMTANVFLGFFFPIDSSTEGDLTHLQHSVKHKAVSTQPHPTSDKQSSLNRSTNALWNRNKLNGLP